MRGISMRYTVILEPKGGFHIWCPTLKGRHSQENTKEEAVAKIQEAIAAYLESLQIEERSAGKRLPPTAS